MNGTVTMRPADAGELAGVGGGMMCPYPIVDLDGLIQTLYDILF
jgi:hypothetical protein